MEKQIQTWIGFNFLNLIQQHKENELQIQNQWLQQIKNTNSRYGHRLISLQSTYNQSKPEIYRILETKTPKSKLKRITQRKKERELYQEQSWEGTEEEGNHRCKEGKRLWNYRALYPSWISNTEPARTLPKLISPQTPPNNTWSMPQIALTSLSLSLSVLLSFSISVRGWDPTLNWFVMKKSVLSFHVFNLLASYFEGVGVST